MNRNAHLKKKKNTLRDFPPLWLVSILDFYFTKINEIVEMIVTNTTIYLNIYYLIKTKKLETEK